MAKTKETNMETGKISVQTENIFPIIKKFLYSEQEIFLRELVSNAVDATNKMKAISSKGEFKGELGNLNIEISIDAENKTLRIKDHGLGMDEDEVKKYLNQVAFSSAEEFIEKYKGEVNIIGHFGLGFYSAFMVADKVEVLSKSYKEGSEAVLWVCNGDTEFSIQKGIKEERGTEIILHINEESKNYLEEYTIENLLSKFCKFLPIPIKFGTKKETRTEEGQQKEFEIDNIINNTKPLWKKAPADLSDEDYLSFYQELYPYSSPPLFWIHLNIDYPFNLTGILYFPKLKNNFEVQKNKIHLYSNQVFVTDDVKEIVPEFLMMLHGVIDSPDIPLNVSRSYLQADSNVRKISSYITKKVAEKLNDLFKKDRKEYEKKWTDISTFIKYGIISDDKFSEKAIDSILIGNTESQYFTIEEYKKHIGSQQTDVNGKIVVLYTHDKDNHYSYIQQCKDKSYDVALMDNIIDNHFIQHLEYKAELSFKRVDSETIDKLIEKGDNHESVLTDSEKETIEALFKDIKLNKATKTELKSLSPNDPPVTIIRPEFIRRMSEMQMMMQAMKGGGEDEMFSNQYTAIINTNHPMIAQTLLMIKDINRQHELADYLFKLALVEQNLLKGAELSNFIKKSMDWIKD